MTAKKVYLIIETMADIDALKNIKIEYLEKCLQGEFPAESRKLINETLTSQINRKEKELVRYFR